MTFLPGLSGLLLCLYKSLYEAVFVQGNFGEITVNKGSFTG